MQVPFIDLKAQYSAIAASIDEVWTSVMAGGYFIGGPEVSAWEEAFASYIGVAHAVSCAQGTDALEIGLEALGVGAGQEVLVPAISWAATAMAVSRVGAKPIFVDVDADGLIGIAGAKQALTPRTTAIIPVHLCGRPVPMPALMQWAKAHNLWVLEDCAQAHGASINGRKVGSWGHLAAFSFYPTKNLGAYGDAGALLTNSTALAVQAKKVANLGQQQRHRHEQIGRNSRIDTLQAAFLSAKLPYLNGWNARRRAIATLYAEAFQNLPLYLPSPIPEGQEEVFHLFAIRSEARDRLQAHLKAIGIATGIHYPQALPDLPPYQAKGHFPNARAWAQTTLSLPLYPELRPEQLDAVIRGVQSFWH